MECVCVGGGARALCSHLRIVHLGTGTGEEEQQGGQPRRQDAAGDHLGPQYVHANHDVHGWYLPATKHNKEAL